MNEILEKSAFLTVPGWNGSGPGHWQSIWEDQHRNFRRVQQRNWSRPARREWIDAIQRHVVDSSEPAFLVAHSLGCLAVAAWAAEHDCQMCAEHCWSRRPGFQIPKAARGNLQSSSRCPPGSFPFRRFLPPAKTIRICRLSWPFDSRGGGDRNSSTPDAKVTSTLHRDTGRGWQASAYWKCSPPSAPKIDTKLETNGKRT